MFAAIADIEMTTFTGTGIATDGETTLPFARLSGTVSTEDIRTA
jgi:hypothetical protein